MTESIMIALIISVPPTIAALAAMIVGLRNSKKADAIHILVNSNMTRVQADLKLALARVKKLEELLKNIDTKD